MGVGLIGFGSIYGIASTANPVGTGDGTANRPRFFMPNKRRNNPKTGLPFRHADVY
jgi:hypothetical protein